jgi:hypothetical protein
MMHFDCLPPIASCLDRHAPLRYIWDDTRASADYRYDPDWVLQAAAGMSTRANMVLCVGLYEWIMWRFDAFVDDPVPRQVLEAAWCATVDPSRIALFELARREWLGPVRGPLWCAVTWLRPAVASGDDFPFEIEDALQYLTRLAVHVCPWRDPFEQWLRDVLTRLTALFPFVPDDPFDDLFSEETARRRGTLIARSVLDTTHAYDIGEGARWSAALLRQANAASNPFLEPVAQTP